MEICVSIIRKLFLYSTLRSSFCQNEKIHFRHLLVSDRITYTIEVSTLGGCGEFESNDKLNLLLIYN